VGAELEATGPALVSCHRRCESTLRGRRSARSSLIGRNHKMIRPVSAFTEQSRAPGTPARTFEPSVTRH